MGVFVADAAPLVVAVGRGRPGVEVKPIGALAAVCVWAEAVYSPFRVANVSGVAEFDGALQASWTIHKMRIERMMGDFLGDMVPPFVCSEY